MPKPICSLHCRQSQIDQDGTSDKKKYFLTKYYEILIMSPSFKQPLFIFVLFEIALKKQKGKGGPKKCYQPLCQCRQKNISATIRISWEIRCFPYAGFLKEGFFQWCCKTSRAYTFTRTEHMRELTIEKKKNIVFGRRYVYEGILPSDYNRHLDRAKCASDNGEKWWF